VAEEQGGGRDEEYVAPSRGNPEIPPMREHSAMEIETLRRMSAAEKLAVMTSLIREAYRLKSAWIRLNEPGLSEQELRKRVLEAMAGDRS
jgi:hypothetical protein